MEKLTDDQIKELWGEDLYKVFGHHIDDQGRLTADGWAQILEDEIPKFDQWGNDNPLHTETYSRMYNLDYEELEDGKFIRPIAEETFHSPPFKVELKPLTEMSGDHFSQIFTAGLAPSFMKEKIAEFWSLRGFHNAIADYGKFDSHRLAVKLGYDVEFTLSH